LIYLIIVGNGIGADGAKFISEGMKENKSITVLDLCTFIQELRGEILLEFFERFLRISVLL